MIIELGIITAVVGVIAAGSAMLANRRWPDQTVRELTNRLVTWLVAGTFVMMIAGCVAVQQTGCGPNDRVCDAPAMAAAGIMILAALIVAAIVVVGVPVIILVLKALRRT